MAQERRLFIEHSELETPANSREISVDTNRRVVYLGDMPMVNREDLDYNVAILNGRISSIKLPIANEHFEVNLDVDSWVSSLDESVPVIFDNGDGNTGKKYLHDQGYEYAQCVNIILDYEVTDVDSLDIRWKNIPFEAMSFCPQVYWELKPAWSSSWSGGKFTAVGIWVFSKLQIGGLFDLTVAHLENKYSGGQIATKAGRYLLHCKISQVGQPKLDGPGLVWDYEFNRYLLATGTSAPTNIALGMLAMAGNGTLPTSGVGFGYELSQEGSNHYLHFKLSIANRVVSGNPPTNLSLIKKW